MPEKEKNFESFGETLNKVIAETVETITEVVSDIVEGVESILLTPDEAEKSAAPHAETTAAEKTPDAEKTTFANALQNASEADDATAELNRTEERVGYSFAALPQAEDPETETVVETGDKTEVERAIARARETSEETAAEIKDPLVADSLPALPVKDQAKLQLQSPNRIFVYWSIARNPYETLHKTLGKRAVNYQLTTRLINLDTNAESFAPAEINGNWWYNVRSNTRYRVDLGFFAFNRPFIKLFSSNTITTPRSAPSPRAATEADWIVSTREFVGVLTASGYSEHVVNAALGVDGEIDPASDVSEETATLIVANRFAPLVGEELDLSELRWALVSLAAGVAFADLRRSLSLDLAAWFDQVLANDPNALERANVRRVLTEIFGAPFVQSIAAGSEIVTERLNPVFGASAIHFPAIKFPKLRFADLHPSDYKSGDLPEHLRFSSHKL